jgi:hypothetical protein
MVARANLQLAVMTRSMQSYYMYTNDNVHQPANFIGNKVAGILFENKIHHTTHFATQTPQIESIQGIHMIPIHAPSALQRSKTFIKEEWDTFFGNGAIDKVDNGWKGIVYANYAIIEPKKAWDFFNGTNFDSNKWLDGGASRTWYMAYSAGKFCSSSPLGGFTLTNCSSWWSVDVIGEGSVPTALRGFGDNDSRVTYLIVVRQQRSVGYLCCTYHREASPWHTQFHTVSQLLIPNLLSCRSRCNCN